MALWILAASPDGTTIRFGSQSSPVQRTAYEQQTPADADDDVAPVPPPKRSPRDPASDDNAATGEGIPGLESPPEPVQAAPKDPPKSARPKAATEFAKPAKEPKRPADAAPKSTERPVQPPRDQPKPRRESPTAKTHDATPRRLPEVLDSDVAPKRADAPHPTISANDDFDADPYARRPLMTSGPCVPRGRLRTWLDGIDVEGWIDQGATINTLSPRNRSNGPVGFNNRSNDYQLNQLYGRLKRDIDIEADRWQLGGRVDFLYGTDSVDTEARGLETFGDFSPKWNSQQLGAALPQCYVEAYCPWGAGLDIKLGHFYSMFGYESVAAPDNFFYSHSYDFEYGEPHSYTGFMTETKLGEFTIQAGMTRGWDNWEDNNNDLGVSGGIGWTSCNRRTSIAVNAAASREQSDPSTNLRALYSLVIQQKFGSRWQYVFQTDYGDEPGAGPNGSLAQWYGIDQYLFYTISDTWKAGLRFEWFYDEGGSRVRVDDLPTLQTGTYYELTTGLNWTPNRHVLVRPEFRWDFTGTPGFYPFGDGTRSNQVLVDCDVVLRF
ncbi:MAG: outer membrane beta-barrel protein [Thermoguttaceae bacterium]